MISLKNMVLVESIKYYLSYYLKDSGILILNPETIEENFVTFRFDENGVNPDTLSYLLDPREDEASDRFMVHGSWYRAELVEYNLIKVTRA